MDLHTYHLCEDWGWFVDTENNQIKITKRKHSTPICFENTQVIILFIYLVIFYIFTNVNIANIVYNY